MEKDVEKILVSSVARLGGKAYKFVSPGNTGVPDRIVLLPGGQMCFVELKTDKGILSRQQKMQIRKMRSLGHLVFVISGEDEARDFIQLLSAFRLTEVAKRFRGRNHEIRSA